MRQKKPEVKIKPNAYQPGKSELEEEVHIDANPEDVIRSAFKQVKVIEDKNA